MGLRLLAMVEVDVHWLAELCVDDAEEYGKMAAKLLLFLLSPLLVM